MARSLLALALAVTLAADAREEVCTDLGCVASQDDEGTALSLLQHRKLETNSKEAKEREGMKPIITCEGDDFLDCFYPFTWPDPTHGFVKYVDMHDAFKHKLLKTNYEGTRGTYIGSKTGTGEPALSVRLESKAKFSSGLFILDVAHIPTGDGTWPAWWLHGDHWPHGGEFDMFEAVNNGNSAKTSFHTTRGCKMNVFGVDNNGDGSTHFSMEGAGVYGGPAGQALNEAGGAIMAVWWSSKGFAMHFFHRNDTIPQDLLDGTPDPATWPTPWRHFPFDAKCDASHFSHMHLTINLSFCGEWAGRDYPGGVEACNEYLRKNEVPEAYWVINYMKVFGFHGADRDEHHSHDHAHYYSHHRPYHHHQHR